ncbi:metallophosphoesterase [Alcanivorax sediminis]|uniref:Calcineurin-like phosphoesterase domain-containing protein n=1 Tax=Alcanivorax sediminis TaxID=2663008 RepID=A0A6N7LW67_9GAMM|nr:metallophosphoesterase [Alcanivorax sediminis]MQX53626.1 hypothetical protein [Alcanivorax sediminis]
MAGLKLPMKVLSRTATGLLLTGFLGACGGDDTSSPAASLPEGGAREAVGMPPAVMPPEAIPPELQPALRFAHFVERTELAQAGVLERVKRNLRYMHITDMQLVDDDAPFPMRVGLLDEVFAATISTGGERPQEEYADEIMASLVQVVNLEHQDDPFAFAIHTGDNIDNGLENEAMRYLDLIDGHHTTVGPISGLSCQPDGQSQSTEDFFNDQTFNCTSLPETVVDSVTGFSADLPSFISIGNHDLLVQGNVAIEPSFQELALLYGRHFLHEDELIRMHFADLTPCNGGSADDDYGHGFGFVDEVRRCDADVENDGYYAFLSGGILHIVLNTVNDDIFQTNEYTAFLPDESVTGHDLVTGLSEGALDLTQWAWLKSMIEAHSDKLVILYSHHTINSFYSSQFDALCGPPGCVNDVLSAAGFVGRDEVRAQLDQYPNLLAWIGGHTHQHRITPFLSDSTDGFWNIETAGLLDLPQENRTIEIWIDEQARKGVIAVDPITHNFELAREIAMTDSQHNAEVAAGEPGDRSALLWFDIEEGITLPAVADTPPTPVFE